MKASQYIWFNGKLIPWKNATVHVLTHALHYGTGVFEGIRAFKVGKKTALFRAKEHFKRLITSAKIYEIPLSFTQEELITATKKLIEKNHLNACYIRPIAFFSYGMGLYPKKLNVDVAIAAWKWGAYLGEEAYHTGVKCKISSWIRNNTQSMLSCVKCSANYINSILAKTEAIRCGYEEAIMLNSRGHITEGPGENIFLVKDGKIFTPPLSDGVLEGITRHSVIKIAEDLHLPIQTNLSLTRDNLFLADEAFLTGTATGIVPIAEVDGQVIGEKNQWPITRTLQKAYNDITAGKNPLYLDWLTKV